VATRGLLVVIFTYGAKSFFEDYRKKSSFFSDPANHKAILTLSPTNPYANLTFKVNDYG
jgi:hypothetical protein